MDIRQHVPALIFVQDRFESRHGRLHRFEGFDSAALADAPVEIGIAIAGLVMKVIGEISRGMGQALGCRAGSPAIGPVTDHAVGLEELLAPSAGCRIRPARAAFAAIGWGGGIPPWVSVAARLLPLPVGSFGIMLVPGRLVVAAMVMVVVMAVMAMVLLGCWECRNHPQGEEEEKPVFCNALIHIVRFLCVLDIALFEVEGRVAFGNHVFNGTSTRNAPAGIRWLWERMDPLVAHQSLRKRTHDGIDTSASTVDNVQRFSDAIAQKSRLAQGVFRRDKRRKHG